ncbi:MAG TPA: hypothetical protein VNT75_12225 [Symbiobacteriaceae bacterium]|nr:hypothetical protein [Symbiobacteriaceae bacterium]
MLFTQIWHIMRADFLERTRRSSFLITLGVMIAFAYTALPPDTADYLTMSVNRARGIYNSAWMGTTVAALAAVLLPLVGFYLVKNAVERDELTGVGQIIATTPIGRMGYLLGKALSNFIFLLAMIAVMIMTAGVMQVIRGEAPIRVGPLVQPFLLLTVPAAALVSALAVLFESVSWLKGGLGNALFFMLWIAVISFGAAGGMAGGSRPPVTDVTGQFWLLRGLRESAAAAGYVGESVNLGHITRTGPLRVFPYDGIPLTPQLLLDRAVWLLVAVLVVVLAAAIFRRFDPSVERKQRQTGKQPATEPEPEVAEGAAPVPVAVTLTPLVRGGGGTFAPVLLAELRLLLKGLPLWWYGGALAFVVAGLAVPAEAGRGWVLPFAWCLPFLRWSAMGAREVRHHTEQMVFSVPRPIRVQLPAAWTAGLLVALGLGLGVIVRTVLSADFAALFALLVGAAFVPTLALTLGIWTGGSKAFEVLFVLLLYVGVLNKTPAFDFMGALDATVAAGIPLYYLGGTLLLLALAVLGRRRQLQM